MQYRFPFQKNLLLGLASKIKSSKKPKQQKESKPTKPVRAKRVEKKTEQVKPLPIKKEKKKVKQKRKPVKKPKAPKAKPSVKAPKETVFLENHTTKYCKLVVSVEWLRATQEDKGIKDFANRSHYEQVYCSGQYSKETMGMLQGIINRVMNLEHVKITVVPMTLHIGSHVMKEIYGKDDHFYAEVQFDREGIKLPIGANPSQKDTIFFNELNALIPKHLKRGIGFVWI
jgi:hypothetical protein